MSKHITLENLNVALPPIKHLIDKKAENVDWNENDPAASGYIKNRPFYNYNKVVDGEYIFYETAFTGEQQGDNLYVAGLPESSFDFETLDRLFPIESDIENADFVVVYDNETYEIKCFVYEGMPSLGNLNLMGGLGEDTGEPFLFLFRGMIGVTTPGEHTISIKTADTIEKRYVKIDEKYLPEMGVGAKGTGANAEVFNTCPADQARGDFSHAEGYYTQAYGTNSHAEGEWTWANGKNSHAEGYNTRAEGNCSHAEGWQSHASNYASHAEGHETKATGHCSHAEGSGTLASSEDQHVQGRYNIEDSSSKYLHIVGNGDLEIIGGTPYLTRSNAHTLDWDGLGWFAGGLKVGGTGQDDENAKTIATEEYVNQKVTDATTNISVTAITDAEIDAICGTLITSGEEVEL